MAPLFRLDDVGLSIEGTTVLEDLTLELPDRGVTVVVGPSGSGKSTLLRLLNGLDRPSSGAVLFRGIDLAGSDIRKLRKRIGYVFQLPTVFDGSGLENLRVAKPDLSDTEASGALERVGLGAEILERDARQLSGGEAQRLCLARTLVTNPEVLLLDEPTSSLDAENVQLVERLVKDIAESGVRVVMVSHDRPQVERLADWIVQMEDGKVVGADEPVAMAHVRENVAIWSSPEQEDSDLSGENSKQGEAG